MDKLVEEATREELRKEVIKEVKKEVVEVNAIEMIKSMIENNVNYKDV